ncbi:MULTISPECIES: DUF1963 domain-containing protein [unclassified Variovorax]|uniref:DUF1963 domain-containing protein n=1 Tax=unclassified Variovorax TaxID=663243 RepID=UPI0008D63E42|nr:MULTISPECIES: DUF1963 domain-containing protein [unclassified Variovorax]SET02192.1 protein of unknown function [Variovorax sp. OV084]SOD24127.1 protein of unknown function [Variovorax sp. YR752]
MSEIPAFKLVPEPLTEEAKSLAPFKWAGDDIGKRHRLGGKPDFIQSSEIPKCSCGKEMTFYAQLDSINDDYVIGDCGMVYVFICFDCLETKSILQFY